jgi:hypothetical protein
MIEVREPMVVRPFIAQLAPDPFLRIKPRLIGWQVFHLDLAMGRQVLSNPRSPMPARSVHEQVQDLSPPSLPQAGQQGQEALGVAPGCAQEAVPTFQGGHPAKDVQAASMVAGRGDTEGLPPSRPYPADPRVFGKTRLVLKHHDVLLRPLPEFF